MSWYPQKYHKKSWVDNKTYRKQTVEKYLASFSRADRAKILQRWYEEEQRSQAEDVRYDTERAKHAVKTPSEVGALTRLVDWMCYPLRGKAFQRLLQEKRAFQRLLEGKLEGFPWLAAAWGDYHALEARREAWYLDAKKWPAPQAANMVREKGRQLSEAVRRRKTAEYLLTYYEALFPWLAEFRSEEVEELLVIDTGEPGEDEARDAARKWLTKAEYEELSTSEKYELALDRYWRKKKTRWEVGRDYERYIGYKYENGGFAVRYQGIVEGFEDLGRDLIATKNGTAEVIQCKYWSQHKTIHEKHIFQLFGTVTAYRVDHPTETVTGVFLTSTRLSERAKQFADMLDIEVQETVPLEKYPCVKCNVSRRTGEKIYHLPFDQQYDKTIIEEERLERYVSTVAEAEALGFRRAKRWLAGDEEEVRARSSSPRRRKPPTN